MNTKDKGDIAEAATITKLKKEGYTVSIPFGDNAKYDLIYDDGSNLIRVQCKNGKYKDGSVVFSCSSNHRKDGNIVRSSYSEEDVDAFIVYCPTLDELYEVPIEKIPSHSMHLRVDPVDHDHSGINWIDDYIMV